MLRVTTLKAGKHGMTSVIDYYAGLAEDQQRRDGLGRGPVDYYLDPDEPPGRWWGKGCAGIGVAGEVKADELRAMLEARHPDTGRPLGRGFGVKSARGFDATFSAPKSVSVLWALSPDPFVRAEVLAAHDAAVTATLGWLERHGAVTRLGTDGTDQVDTKGLTVALFRQHTSRSVDPQLHTHAVISSKVQGPRGRWLSLDARFLKRQQRSMGWLYAAGLRAELTARLGVSWDPVVDGHADIAGIGPEIRELFSKRSAQVEEKLATYIKDWSADHDGAEPSPRTVARLHRWAAMDSRPAKEHGREPNELRAEWLGRAREARLELPALPRGRQPVDEGLVPAAVVYDALEALSARSSTWLRADVARELSARVPAGAFGSAERLLQRLDIYAESGAQQCQELHPPAPRGAQCRADGRPITEHVVDRRLSSHAVLDQEAALLAWARTAVADTAASPARVRDGGLDAAQANAARAVAGTAELVLVVGPAGAGKTTMLAAAVDSLGRQRRPVLGLAPSGKAADVLARESGSPSMTVAKLLSLQGAPRRLPKPGTTLLLDEAGMASTNDLERLVGLAQEHRWRVVCVGDPHQLPAVERGGMFAHWCEELPAHHLEGLRRFEQPWEAEASLLLRAGDAQAAQAYAAQGRLHTTHPALVAERVARRHATVLAKGASVAITTSSAAIARAINTAIRSRQGNWRRGPSVRLHDNTKVSAGDVIATRHNDARLLSSRGEAVRNRQTWTVEAVGPEASLTVTDPERGRVVLPADYVARHVELGWAVTGYGNQGVTADHGICVVEPSSSRAGIYVGMTRGRTRNDAWIVDASELEEPEDAFAAAIARPANGLTAHAMWHQLRRARRSLDRIDVEHNRTPELARTHPAPSKPPPSLSL